MLSSSDSKVEPALKKQKYQDKAIDLDKSEEFDKFFLDFNQNQIYQNNSRDLGDQYEPPSNAEPNDLNEEINKALSTFNEFNQTNSIKLNFKNEANSSATESSSPMDSPGTLTSSVTSNDEEVYADDSKQNPSHRISNVQSNLDDQASMTNMVNQSTLTSIKQSMINTSKLISTFTTLKTTYLKLCKEFNYLLNKFKDNEKIKIELINENNELKHLLMEIIKQRELEKSTTRHKTPISNSRKRKCPSS